MVIRYAATRPFSNGVRGDRALRLRARRRDCVGATRFFDELVYLKHGPTIVDMMSSWQGHFFRLLDSKAKLQVPTMEHWSDRLRLWMKERDWNVPDLARASGVSEDSIYKYLKGRTEAPRGDVLAKLAGAFGRSASELKYGVQQKALVATRRIPLLTPNKLGTLPITTEMVKEWQGAFVSVGPTDDINANAYAVAINDEACSPKIEAGDVVIVEPDQTPSPGEFVVAHVDGVSGGVCRKYRPNDAFDKTRFLLTATSDDFPPIKVPEDAKGEILGRVSKVIKTFARRD